MKRNSPRLILILAIALVIPATALGSPSTGTEASTTSSSLRATSGLLAALPPGGTFVDDNGHQFEGAIEAIAAERITSGCNPPVNDRFCLEDDVTRGEMAVFLARAFGYTGDADDSFVDDDGRFYEAAANRIHREGVTQGCNPPTNNRYCGEKPITRGQMAALLVRALGLGDDGGGDRFRDDDDSIYEDAIDRLGTAGITSGCNPPDNDEFCPTERVTRGQMAVFIARALGLSPIVPPPANGVTRPPGETVSGTITGKACPHGCVVTGEATLKGDIDLQGDLAVFGGTLVARPGVDLDGNGFQIMFMNGGEADFQGSKVFTWSDRGAKQNLKRDINFRNMRRIIWMDNGGASTLKYFTVSDSGTSTLGDYPLHWHLNGDSTRGTIVEGVVVINGKNHALVPHGSNGITFKDVIARNTRGDAFWWDPPGTNDCTTRGRFCTTDNSNDVLLEHILVDGVTNGPGDDRGFTLSAFVLGAGSGNTIRNSAAINVNPSHGKNCSGYHWPSDANRNEGGTKWSFSNNFGTSKCHGIFVWQNDGSNHVVNGFTGGGIEHGAYRNEYEYTNVNVPYVNVHAGGWSITDSKVGILRLLQPGKVSPNDPTLDVADTTIRRLIVNNETPEGRDNPPHYEFSNIELTCKDVEYLSVEPGTTILIDGVNCG